MSDSALRKITAPNNRTNAPTTKLLSKIGTVFEPSEGSAYAHHPHICFFNGKFYAAWSCGIKNEDDCGQRVMLASSVDGLNWTNQRVLVSPKALGNEKATLTACGFYAYGDRLNLYFGSYAYDTLGEDGFRLPVDAHHTDTGLYVITTENGEDWSMPKDLNLPIVPNFGPTATNSGRLIIAGSVCFPYTDDPSGLTGWKISGIYGDAFKDMPFADDSESIHMVTKRNGWACNLICEGSFYELDGAIYMLLRSNSDYMWLSVSFDDGESWTAPQKTRFTNGNTKFHFGRLSSGKYYCVNNSCVANDRYPLNLHLSGDGVNFNESYILRDEPYSIKYHGLYKGGAYAYPHSIEKDGKLYVIYSKCKETIEVTVLDLDELK